MIKDLIDGASINQVACARSMSLRDASNGSKYIRGTLVDKTGSIPVVHWGADKGVLGRYTETGVVDIYGRVETFNGNLQVVVSSVQAVVDEDKIEKEKVNLLPALSSDNLVEIAADLDKMVIELESPYKDFITSCLTNVFPSFYTAPAAQGNHHAYIGGLLEHTVTVLKYAQAIDFPYQLNKQLLYTGIILHDAGKCVEIQEDIGFPYSTKGKLLGHISLAAMLIFKHNQDTGILTAQTCDKLIHMILSHHGKLDWGSPVVPKTKEAIALHYLECMDSKLKAADAEESNDDGWTQFVKSVGSDVFKA